MTLRVRLALAATIAAALAAIGVAVLGVTLARFELQGSIDRALRSDATSFLTVPQARDGRNRPGRPEGGPQRGDLLPRRGTPPQIIDTNGNVITQYSSADDLPIDESDRAVAAGQIKERFKDVSVDERHYRVVTLPAGNGLAIQMARPTDDIDRTIRTLTLGSTVLALLGTAFAAGLGIVLAQSALRPVARLSAAAGEVAARQDPSYQVPEAGGHELAQLGRSINTMLASLAEAREHERRLIDDAAHELRTPLTSLRTNIEVLASGRLASGADFDELLADLRAQTEEFSSLVGDLDTLARGSQQNPATDETVEFAKLVGAAVRRAQRRAGPVRLLVSERNPAMVQGNPALLEQIGRAHV